MLSPRNGVPHHVLLPLVIVPLAIGSVPRSLQTELRWAQPPVSTIPNFQIPSSLAAETQIRIDGSSSMALINEALVERFQTQFPDATITVATNGTDDALRALQAGEVDVAALGRSLTAAEKAQGFTEVPINREKIAIVVGADNPFTGSLTTEQFVRIFRGEVTNWSELGGPDQPIRVIDHPDFSDTRQALSQYEIFQGAPFATGATGVQLAADDTASIVQQLGADGISYAIANQVLNQPSVRVLPMHGTLPDDPRYPYSQSRGYVFAGNASPGVQAFLGLATSASGQVAIQEARQQEVAAIAQATNPAAAPLATDGEAPDGAATEGSATTDGATDGTADGATDGATAEGTAIAPIPANGAATAEGAAPGTDASAGAPVAGDDETATAIAPAIGNETSDGTRFSPLWWLLLPLLLLPLLFWWLKGRGSGRSDVVPPGEAKTALPLGAAVIPPVAARAVESRLILTPRNCRDAYAYWEVPGDRLEDLRQQGGRNLMVRLYDVTNIPDTAQDIPHSVKQFDCSELTSDLHIPIEVDNRDYVAELGYVTDRGHWLPVVRSPRVRVPACSPPTEMPKSAAVAGGAVAGAVAAVGGAALANRFRTATEPRPVVAESRIVLTPRSDTDLYAYWELSDAHKTELQEQQIQQLNLCLHDATQVEGFDPRAARSSQQYACSPTAQDQHLSVPLLAQSDEFPQRDYVAELGYFTSATRWSSLATSDPVRVTTKPGAILGTKVDESPTLRLVSQRDRPPIADMAPVGGDRPPIAPDVVPVTSDRPPIAPDVVPITSDRPPVADVVPVSGDRPSVADVAPVSGDRPPIDNVAPVSGDRPNGTAKQPLNRQDAVAADVTKPDAIKAVGAFLAGGAAIAAGAGKVASSWVEKDADSTDAVAGDRPVPAAPVPEQRSDCRIILVPRHSDRAYAYWEVSDDVKAPVRQQGGEALMLRVHDATGLDIDFAAPHHTSEYACTEDQRDQQVAIPMSDRDYIAELGYYTGDRRWLRIIRSFHVRVF
ncbi:MAG: DUF4912 domain-containing protein [Synechococcales bacterium]|nr:DUF4912 domain-containing protein [Synechococcales bacterium]